MNRWFVVLPIFLALPFSAVAKQPQPDPVGLSLFFQEGAAAPISFVGNPPRFAQEIDVTASADSTTDVGISQIIASGDLSGLDWSGVTQVEEDWRPDGAGTFTRQRFYRGAKWMKRDSTFMIFPTDEEGYVVGNPIVVHAGKDDKWKAKDDEFIRRFDARQTTFGCQAVGDCSNSTRFVAQGLVQLHIALHENQDAELLPASAAALTMYWTEDWVPRTVLLDHVAPEDSAYAYGFEPNIDIVSVPLNGLYYLPGETVTIKTTFRDGDGNRLHPEGSLPTYGQFFRGEVESGLRYYDGFRLNPTLYYALKHREGMAAISVSGPTNNTKVFNTVLDGAQFFAPQANITEDGYTTSAILMPSGLSIFGGAFINPSFWDLPASDTYNVMIPATAQPGTYVVTLKARRDFGGEALNRMETVDIQVGSVAPTAWNGTTGRCESCHSGASAMNKINHGTNDRRACSSCHMPLSFEPDNALDIRIHAVHDRSDRVVGNVNDCSMCHLTTPTGPGRGFLQ